MTNKATRTSTRTHTHIHARTHAHGHTRTKTTAKPVRWHLWALSSPSSSWRPARATGGGSASGAKEGTSRPLPIAATSSLHPKILPCRVALARARGLSKGSRGPARPVVARSRAPIPLGLSPSGRAHWGAIEPRGFRGHLDSRARSPLTQGSSPSPRGAQRQPCTACRRCLARGARAAASTPWLRPGGLGALRAGT